MVGSVFCKRRRLRHRDETHIPYHLRMIPQTAAQWSVTQAINSRARGNYPKMEPFIPTSGITIQESQP
jgi:hypothetical protein